MKSTLFINKESSTPIFVQVINWLTLQITTGNWPPNYQLLSEPDLANELGVSRGSLRKAIGDLVSKGMLEQVHGKGTFVRNFVLEHTWASKLVSTSEELNWRGIPFTTEVITQEICNPPENRIAEILNLNQGEKVVHLVRRRLINNEPIVVHETFFSANQFSDLVSIDFTTHTMVTDILEDRCKLRLSKAEHTISAISAEQKICDWLNINVGEPVLYDEHILIDELENTIEFTKGWFRSDKMHLKTVVYRDT